MTPLMLKPRFTRVAAPLLIGVVLLLAWQWICMAFEVPSYLVPTPALIAKTLVALLDPVWLRIGAYWYPRGGIPIDVFWQTGAPPEGLWVPDQGVPGYRGRG